MNQAICFSPYLLSNKLFEVQLHRFSYEFITKNYHLLLRELYILIFSKTIRKIDKIYFKNNVPSLKLNQKCKNLPKTGLAKVSKKFEQFKLKKKVLKLIRKIRNWQLSVK